MKNISYRNNKIINGALATLLIMAVSFLPDSYADDVISQDDRARLGMAESLNNLGRYGEASSILKGLYQRYPYHRETAVELARAVAQGDNAADTVVWFENLKRDFPDNKNIAYLYAYALERNHRLLQARREYLQLLHDNPGSRVLRLKIADISAVAGDYKEARRYYGELLKFSPQDRFLKLKIADTFFWEGEYGRALEIYSSSGVDPRSDKARALNMAAAFMAGREFAQAIELYTVIASEYPRDSDAKVSLVSAFYAAGRRADAGKVLEELVLAEKDNPKQAPKLIEAMAGGQDYDKAIVVCRSIIAGNPGDRNARLWLARVYSWSKRYAESIQLYDSLIKEYPDWITPGREKARVLGWMRRYKDSIEEYRRIPIGNDDEVVSYEMEAKGYFYKRFDPSATRFYLLWLEEEPDNLEALFDLAQLYSRNNQWNDAERTYNRVLRLSAWHFRARKAAEKVKLLSTAPLFKSGIEFYEADSSPRDVDKKYFNVNSSLRLPLNKELYLWLRQDGFFYSFAERSSVKRETTLASLEYYFSPDVTMQFGYAYNNYSANIKDSHNFGSQLKARLLDPLQITISQARDDVIENYSTLVNRLYKDDYKARMELDLNRRIATGADYTFSHYNDGNDKYIYGFDVLTRLLYEPRSLIFNYRYEAYGYRQPKDYYFTPHSFHFNKMGLQWRHYLNKEELFWGANDIYYSLSYHINFDVHNQTGHTLSADFHRDWNDRLATHLEWSKVIYNHRQTYKRDTVSIYLKYYF